MARGRLVRTFPCPPRDFADGPSAGRCPNLLSERGSMTRSRVICRRHAAAHRAALRKLGHYRNWVQLDTVLNRDGYRVRPRPRIPRKPSEDENEDEEDGPRTVSRGTRAGCVRKKNVDTQRLSSQTNSSSAVLVGSKKKRQQKTNNNKQQRNII